MMFSIPIDRFIFYLEKLYTPSPFPTVVFQQTPYGLISKQWNTKKSDIWRFFRINPSSFDFYERTSEPPVFINCRKLLRFSRILKKRGRDRLLLTTFGDAVCLRSKNVELKFLVEQSYDIKESPIFFDKNIPTVINGPRLDTCFSIPLSEFEKLFRMYRYIPYFLQFSFSDLKYSLHTFQKYNPSYTRDFYANVNCTGKVTMYTEMIKYFPKIFSGEYIAVCTQPDAPAWFYETGENYYFGIFVDNID